METLINVDKIWPHLKFVLMREHCNLMQNSYIKIKKTEDVKFNFKYNAK